MSGHSFHHVEDDDGFVIAACMCGWKGFPVPDIEDAADCYGDHRATVAAIATAKAIKKADLR